MSKRQIVLIALVALLFVLLGSTGVVVFVNDFLVFSCRSKGAEANSMLEEICDAQQRYRAEHGRFAGSFEELDFEPTGKIKRYTYYLTASSTIDHSVHDTAAASAGVVEPLPACAPKPFVGEKDFRIVAISEYRRDYDIWAVTARCRSRRIRDGCDWKRGWLLERCAPRREK